MVDDLTEVEAAVLECFVALKRKLGRVPTLVEMQTALKKGDHNAIRTAWARCVRKGYAKHREVIPMGLTAKGKRWIASQE